MAHQQNQWCEPALQPYRTQDFGSQYDFGVCVEPGDLRPAQCAVTQRQAG